MSNFNTIINLDVQNLPHGGQEAVATTRDPCSVGTLLLVCVKHEILFQGLGDVKS